MVAGLKELFERKQNAKTPRAQGCSSCNMSLLIKFVPAL